MASNSSESRLPYLVRSGATLDHLENPVEADEAAGSQIVTDSASEERTGLMVHPRLTV